MRKYDMKKIVIVMCFALFFVALTFSGCNIFNSEKDNYKAAKEYPYEIVKTDTYKQYGDSGKYYYIYVLDETSSREKIESIYNKVTNNDNYDIHTVMFYFNRDDAAKDTDGKLAKVIMKQYSSGIDPAYMWQD